jgi:hypothetical protein
MSDRIKIQRRKQIADSYSYPQLATDTQALRMGNAQGTVSHEISRISLRPQARLTVSQPGDFYEQEADRVAQQVMGMGIDANNTVQREASPQEEEENLQLKSLSNTITPLVQREEIPEEEEEEELVQMKSLGNLAIQREEIPEEEEEEEELVQAKSSLQRFDDGGLEASSDISSKLHSRQGQGTPLADDVRNFMEPRFGVDFSNVKVHTDGEAVKIARNLDAQALTYGNDVYFGAGKSPGNNELTAHELTHVVQQTGAVQREPNEEGETTTSTTPESGAGIEPFDIQIPFSTPEPIDIPTRSSDEPEPGDYPLPDNSTYAMAKLVEGAPLVQRDDNDKPHPSADAQNQSTLGLVSPTGPPAPWSLQGTLIYRNINVGQLTKPQNKSWLDFGHEPNISLTLDSQGGFSIQEAITLINLHWTPPWNKELEVGLQAAATQSLLPKLSSAYGGSVQAEQHIIPWFSITLNISGNLTPGQRGEKGTFSATAGLGGLIHFDGL